MFCVTRCNDAYFRSNQVILMFSTFDVLAESSLDEKSAKEFMTVGWGKKETQFHGSAGKNARKKQEIEIVNIESLDKTISCCWRGDGEFFAVNYVGANGRMFKVYNKEGLAQYTSEVCANLQVPIAWKPSGLWITKPEILSNKHVITLFERNGLKHNELVLSFTADEEQVVNLSWSLDSDVFLIETTRNDVHRLYFYTICNYHWYLKSSLEFEGKVSYAWSKNFAEPKQLVIVNSQGELQLLKFDFVVNHSNGRSEADESIVAVIDGKKLLLTNFKSQMRPPPMASLEVILETPINVVDFLYEPSESLDSNSFFTLDGKNNIKIYRCVFEPAVNGRKLTSVEVVKEFSLEDFGLVINAVWIDENLLLLVKESTIAIFSIESAKVLNEIQFENVVGSVAVLSSTQIIAQLIDGTLIGLDVEDNLSFNDKDLEKLPEFCEKIVATTSNGQPAVYALKNIKKKLFLNSKELATEVTSFSLTSDNDFLIFTTIGEVKFVRIESKPDEIAESRRVERGSRIVSLVKDKSQIIFQLPRGNLETITPRILSLKIIKRYLKNVEYRKAFDLLRKERINLNLLIDLNPQKFLKELPLFVEQIDNVQWLNLFLTELRNEDVTLTMYKFCGKIEDTEIFDEKFSVDNKISFLCEKMLGIFKKHNAQKYLLPIITCHVKNQQLETALQVIWDLKQAGSSGEADEALKYLLYLIDVNMLYNIALGMYDFQLVLYVAQKSQKDPKEYVPFLNDLNRLDPDYAKFKIDCHLKRYAKAIKSISVLSDDEEKFEECAEVIKKHFLFEAAMEAFKSNQKCYQRACVMFGDHLRTKGKLLDASLMYERGGEYQQALSSARNTLEWQRCVVLARKCSYSEVEMKELALKLSSSLGDSGRFKEAAQLVRKFHPENVSMLVEILTQGRLYSEALFEIAASGDESLIETKIKPQLENHLKEARKAVEDDLKAYLDQKERLSIVRREKQKKQANPHEDDDGDMFSDTTSMVSSSQNSRTSSRTFKSSKNKRKHERKLQNLKIGNKFEDVALVDSLWKLVHKIISNEKQTGIKELLKNAIELGIDDEARNLQRSFKNLLLVLKNSMDEIWLAAMLEAGKYPDTEEAMMQYNDSTITEQMSYELISKLYSLILNYFDVFQFIFRIRTAI